MSSEVRLGREMRLMDVTMIGVGAMIGAGIFVLTGIAVSKAGGRALSLHAVAETPFADIPHRNLMRPR